MTNISSLCLPKDQECRRAEFDLLTTIREWTLWLDANSVRWVVCFYLIDTARDLCIRFKELRSIVVFEEAIYDGVYGSYRDWTTRYTKLAKVLKTSLTSSIQLQEDVCTIQMQLQTRFRKDPTRVLNKFKACFNCYATNVEKLLKHVQTVLDAVKME